MALLARIFGILFSFLIACVAAAIAAAFALVLPGTETIDQSSGQHGIVLAFRMAAIFVSYAFRVIESADSLRGAKQLVWCAMNRRGRPWRTWQII
jgi:electron transfer flavoprotein alpha/beta subunit